MAHNENLNVMVFKSRNLAFAIKFVQMKKLRNPQGKRNPKRFLMAFGSVSKSDHCIGKEVFIRVFGCKISGKIRATRVAIAPPIDLPINRYFLTAPPTYKRLYDGMTILY